MINNMKSFFWTFIFSSPLSYCFFFFILHCCSFSFSPLCALSLCWTSPVLCWQALRSQNALHRESDWWQSLWLQTSTEEDLPETKAHQTLLNTWHRNLKHDAHCVAMYHHTSWYMINENRIHLSFSKDLGNCLVMEMKSTDCIDRKSPPV